MRVYASTLSVAAISAPSLEAVNRKRKSNRGHNLLEVILASMVFSVLMVLFSGLWAQYYKGQAVSRNHLAASGLGRKVLEEHLSAGYNACPDGYVETGNITSSTRVRGRDANCVFNYQFESHDRGVDFRSLTVTVTWSDVTGAGPKSLVYDTYVYRTQ